MRRCIVVAAAFVLLSGCRGFDIVQTAVFSNEDGELVYVGYGRSKKPHSNTFMNPATGKETGFMSRLAVEVEMPDGEVFDAWQCMNFTKSGTMYRTDGGEWVFLANGFTCLVYRQNSDKSFREVFRGVLCDAPQADNPKDDKWRKLKKDSKGSWR